MVKEKIKTVIQQLGDGTTRVSLNKGTEFINLEISGNSVHIYASDRSGGRTIAKLKFLKDQVVAEE